MAQKIKYFSVFTDFRQQEYDTYDNAIAATNFLVFVETLEGSEYNYGWLTRHIVIKIFSKGANGVVDNYANARWCFEIVKSRYVEPANQIGKNAKHTIRFTDPKGGVKEFETTFALMKSGEFEWLFAYLQLFQKYSTEDNIRVAELVIENEQLKHELEQRPPANN